MNPVLSKSATNDASGNCTNLPLCVDLDGTLLRTDSLIEMLFALLKKQPGAVLPLLGPLLRGKAAFKHAVAALDKNYDDSNLPLNEKLLAYLRLERGRGRRLVLATGANKAIAERISARLGLFDEVIASDAETNLCGEHKCDQLVRRFGKGGFAYAGNDDVDRCLWAAAGEAIVVNASHPLSVTACREARVSLIFDDKEFYPAVVFRALRPHQWAKNLLLFLPLITAHQLLNPSAIVATLLMFVAFGLCASSGYLVNDLLDIDSDREHPKKRLRPIASGALPILHAIFLVPVLLLVAALIASFLPVFCMFLLVAYFLISVLYSLYFKRKMLLDVYCLAGLYTLRVIAGGEAAGIECSYWLLSFSGCLFTSLALLKRFAELHATGSGEMNAEKRRGYIAGDIQAVSAIGIGSGMLCVLVLALYITSPDVSSLYASPNVLWLICPLLLYWVSRIWLIAFRGRMSSDPVLFALRDRISYAVGGLTAIIIIAASFGVEAFNLVGCVRMPVTDGTA